jgi:hypothetical protein
MQTNATRVRTPIGWFTADPSMPLYLGNRKRREKDDRADKEISLRGGWGCRQFGMSSETIFSNV